MATAAFAAAVVKVNYGGVSFVEADAVVDVAVAAVARVNYNVALLAVVAAETPAVAAVALGQTETVAAVEQGETQTDEEVLAAVETATVVVVAKG